MSVPSFHEIAPKFVAGTKKKQGLCQDFRGIFDTQVFSRQLYLNYREKGLTMELIYEATESLQALNQQCDSFHGIMAI